jgi:hypothetical protein
MIGKLTAGSMVALKAEGHLIRLVPPARGRLHGAR